ncbi:MAG: AsmA family protein [Gammaproteobacteria bacterium]|jgi:uncharacterized protein involved in outer membrane biogenesis
MKRALKITGIVAGIIVLLIVAAAVTLPFLINPNDYKDNIEQLVQKRTGRELTIQGDMKLSVFPWLGVELPHVALANAPGFGERPFAAFDSADVRVRLLPLIRGKVEVGTVEIDGLQANLARKADGSTNWQDIVERLGQGSAQPAPQEESKGGLPLSSLSVNGLELSNGAVSWSDEVLGGRYELEQINLKMGALAPDVEVPVSLAFTGHATHPQASGKVSLTAMVKADPAGPRVSVSGLSMQFSGTAERPSGSVEGKLSGNFLADAATGNYRSDKGAFSFNAQGDPLPVSPLNADLSWQGVAADLGHDTVDVRQLLVDALGAHVELEMDAAGLTGKPQVHGVLKVPDFDPARLVKLAETRLPKGVSLAGLGKVGLNTRFDVDMARDTASAHDLELHAFGATLKGDFDAGGLTGRPSLVARIDMPPFPASGVVQAVRQFAPPKLNLGALSTLGLSGRVSVDTAKGTAHLDGIHLLAAGASVTANITARNINDKPAAVGSIEVPAFDTAEAAAVAGAFLPSGMDPKALGTAAFSTDFNLDLQKQTAEVKKLDLTALGVHATASVSGTSITEGARLKGALAVDRFSPREVLGMLGQKLPPLSDPKTLGALSLSTRFELDPNALRLTDLKTRLDDTGIRGRLAVNDIKRKSIAFNLAVDSINVDRYLPPAAPEAKSDKGKPTDINAIRLPVDPIRQLDVDGNLSIGKLQAMDLHVSDLKLGAKAAGGRLQLTPMSAALYKGRYAGTVDYDVRSGVPKVALSQNLTNIHAGPLVKDLFGQERISGTGRVSLNLHGRGKTVGALRRSLSGQVGVSLKDGAIEGFNLWESVREAAAVARGKPAPQNNAPNRTEFAELSGSGKVASGVLDNRDLKASLPFLRVTGEGKVNLVNATLDYNVKAKVVGKPELDVKDLAGTTIPIRISGPLAGPKVRPDVAEVLKEKAREELKKKQENLKDKLKNKLKDKLGDIFH